jgi:hypothetical protein
VKDYISFADAAPTLLELAGIDVAQTGMQPMSGNSFCPQLYSDKSGQIDPARNFVLLGRERNDIGRPNDEGYPIRGIIKDNIMYLHNFEPGRWPACDPITGYLDVDGSPTKTEILKMRTQPETYRFWQLSFGKRRQEELFDLDVDPDCLTNLANHPEKEELREQMKAELFALLTKQEDPRMLGHGDVFDRYPFAAEEIRNFYERYRRGEKMNTGWVEPSDFESDVQE